MYKINSSKPGVECRVYECRGPWHARILGRCRYDMSVSLFRAKLTGRTSMIGYFPEEINVSSILINSWSSAPGLIATRLHRILSDLRGTSDREPDGRANNHR
jgi:hypothetical protein